VATFAAKRNRQARQARATGLTTPARPVQAVHVTAMPLFAFPFPAIDPIAIAVGPVAIRWYALAYVAGLLGGWFYARRLAARTELWKPLPQPSAADIDDLIVWVALGVVLGGRIGYVLFYNFGSYLSNPLEMLAVWRGGMSFHGGFIGAVLAIVLFARSRSLNPLAMLDMAAVVTPIGLFFGRIANFINGELWGRPAPDFPYAVVFPHAGPLPRHPSQLYEALGEGLILFVILVFAVRRFGFRRPGLVGGIFVLGYAVARIVCEFFREPDAQLGYLFGANVQALGGGITMGMLLSVPMALIGAGGILMAVRGYTRPAKAVEAA
jgi:phosphatidylglycerol---prolipoprotein diacylglyceryl transferase